ncbi:uncharacterized protein LOC142233941 [Haematobia irritans]|uniref:uncharacterized protein LOC142233941 n=1 Tax=Haematobia irritans TaxID=7368 RepID=UPI003F4F81DD
MKIVKFCIVLITLISRVLTAKQSLATVIEELNENLRMQWNLLLTTEINNEIELLLKPIEIPKLLIATNNDKHMEWRNIGIQHKHKFLAIAYVIGEDIRQRENNRKQVERLRNSIMDNLHFIDILWIYQMANSTDLEFFAKSQWIAGYMNTLYFVNGDLYSYSPVPRFNVKKLLTVEDYYNRKPITNYHSYPLTTAVIQNPPGCYKYTNSKGAIITTGTLWKPLQLFIDIYNFQSNEFVYKYDSFDYETIVHAIREKKIDILPSSVYGWNNVTHSRIMRNVNFLITVPSPKIIPVEQYIRKPFSKGLWLFNYIGLFTMAATLTYILSKETPLNSSDFIRALLYVHNCVLYQYQFNIKVKTFWGKMCTISMLFYGFVAINMYQARLASILTINIYESKIETLDDLKSTNLLFLVSRVDKTYIDKIPDLPKVILERIKVVDFKSLYHARRNLNTSFIHGALENQLDYVFFQQKYLSTPLIHKLDIVVYTVQSSYTVRKDLPYIEQFNRFLGHLSSSGLLEKFEDESWWEGINSGEIRFFDDHQQPRRGLLNFHFFKQSLLLWFTGMLLSILVFVFENIFYRRKSLLQCIRKIKSTPKKTMRAHYERKRKY